jgi:hypothetical protein
MKALQGRNFDANTWMFLHANWVSSDASTIEHESSSSLQAQNSALIGSFLKNATHLLKAERRVVVAYKRALRGSDWCHVREMASSCGLQLSHTASFNPNEFPRGVLVPDPHLRL